MVTVFNKVSRFLRRAGPQIDGDHRLDVGLLAPAVKLADAELVALFADPRVVQAHRTLFFGANTIAPVEAGDIVAAGIAHGGDVHLFHQVNHVLAEPLRIGFRVAGFVNTGIYRAAQMLNERAKQPGVNLGDAIIRGNGEVELRHNVPP